MFREIASDVDERVKTLAKSLEAQEIGTRVIAGRIYSVPHILFDLDVSVQKPRRFNILEEFILKSAHDLNPRPTLEEVTGLLGLDPIFTTAVYKQLQTLSALTMDGEQRLRLTESGAQFYQQGSVPQPPEKRRGRLVFSLLTRNWWFAHNNGFSSRLDEGLFPFADEEMIKGIGQQTHRYILGGSSECLKMIQTTSVAASLGWHDPKQGSQLVSIAGVSDPKAIYTSYALLLVQDTLANEGEDNVYFRVFELGANRSDADIATYLQSSLVENQQTLSTFIQNEFPQIVWPEIEIPHPANAIAHPKPAEEAYKELERVKKEQQTDKAPSKAQSMGVAELLRDGEIRPRFLKALEQAQHTILIISPWMSAQVIDSEFINRLKLLAKRNVTTIIGWGIAKRIQDEDRPPSDALLATLHQITRQDGEPGIAVWWVGNQHSKDVLVDHDVHLSGSHNWLSYRGDRQLRGESTYYVTVRDAVDKALASTEPLLADQAERHWSMLLSQPLRDEETFRRCCVTWVATRQPQRALQLIAQLTDTFTDADMPISLLKTVCASLCYYPKNAVEQLKIFDLLQQEILPVLAIVGENISATENMALVKALTTLFSRYYSYDKTQVEKLIDVGFPIWSQIGLLQPDQRPADFVKTLGINVKETPKRKKQKK